MKINRSDYEKFHEYGAYIPKRFIYFGSEIDIEGVEGGVDYASSKKIIKNLLFLDTINHKIITLYINTPGGCWYNGMAIYDIIKEIKAPVKAIGIGQIMSMGSIIFQACKYRYLLKNSTFMIHDGYEDMGGEAKSFEAWGDYSKKIRKQMYEIYLVQIQKKHKKFTIERVENLCTHDKIMSAKDAVKLGLADKII